VINETIIFKKPLSCKDTQIMCPSLLFSDLVQAYLH